MPLGRIGVPVPPTTIPAAAAVCARRGDQGVAVAAVQREAGGDRAAGLGARAGRRDLRRGVREVGGRAGRAAQQVRGARARRLAGGAHEHVDVAVAVDVAGRRERGAEAGAGLRAVDALQRRRGREVAHRAAGAGRARRRPRRRPSARRRGRGLADRDVGDAVAVLVADAGERRAEPVARLRAVDAVGPGRRLTQLPEPDPGTAVVDHHADAAGVDRRQVAADDPDRARVAAGR